MAKVTAMRMSAPSALKLIRELAQDSSNVAVLPHAKKSMRKRGILRRQVDVCLQRGIITEGPFLNIKGNWQVTMERLSAGDEITIVVAVEMESRLLVITVY